MAARDPQDQNIAALVAEATDRMAVLVREEIELAKAEVEQKISQLIRGVAVAIAAGVFAIFGLVMLMHGGAWLAWYSFFPDNTFFWGFFVVAGVLFLLGGLAGWLAARAVKSGSPPVPEMAIDEAKLIRETLSEATGGEASTAPAGAEPGVPARDAS